MNANVRFHRSPAVAVLTLILGLSAAQAQTPPWGGSVMQPGIAAVSCAAPSITYPSGTSIPQSNSFAFGVYDFRTPPATAYSPNLTAGTLWNPPLFHHPDWSVENIGSVYGIALDPAGDIYVAAHGIYGAAGIAHYNRYGTLGGGAANLNAAGSIYHISGTTGTATLFAQIPGQQVMSLPIGLNSGPGLGNVAYDPGFDQFFATSLEDGKIYRIDNAGTVFGTTHDPFAPDNGAPGLPPQSERIWGIGVLGSAVYYGTWNTNGTPTIEVRKVDLDGSGDFISSSDANVLTLPASTGSLFVAVADIAFSKDGSTMLVGERTMQGSGTSSYNHNSRVHMVNTGTWTVTNSLKAGNNTMVVGGGEAYGGVSWGQEGGVDEQVIWMTSADMAAQSGGNSPGPHGIFGVRPVDFPVGPAFTPMAFKVPFDPTYTSNGPDRKGSGGDVEIMQLTDECDVAVERVDCPESKDDPYVVDLIVTNLSDQVAHHVVLNPCPAAELPAGAVTTQPTPQYTSLVPPLNNGDSATLPGITLPNVPLSGVTVCFLVTLLDESGNACCTKKLCIDLPRCDCVEVIDQEITCELQADGTIKYTIILNVLNRTDLSDMPYDFHHVTFLPSPSLDPDIDPNLVTGVMLNPDPIPAGATGTVKFCYTGVPGPIYANISFHNEGFEKCCALEDYCLDLPDCGAPMADDECRVTARVACCPEIGLPGGGTATITFTICNNGTAPKTYSLFANGVSPSLCPLTFTPADFVLPATVGPVLPGDCATVTVVVRCESFKPGECAEFEICARPQTPFAGPPICCRGVVYMPENFDPTVKIEPPAPLPIIVPGGLVALTFAVQNTSDLPTDATLRFSDNELLMLFTLSDRGDGAVSGLEVPLVLGPLERQDVTVFARLSDIAGPDIPSFFDVFVELGINGPPGSGAAALITPIRGGPSLDPGLPQLAIRSVSIVPEPPSIDLEIPTILGAVYQIQQSLSLLEGSWENTPCAAAGAFVNPDGSFVGTGGIVTCRLPCDFSDQERFYRILWVE